uniref:Putative secreted protein n=1 Tax=Anopheles darlingi TaxID=43151 RepID=A0A2M4D1M2_ANODA
MMLLLLLMLLLLQVMLLIVYWMSRGHSRICRLFCIQAVRLLQPRTDVTLGNVGPIRGGRSEATHRNRIHHLITTVQFECQKSVLVRSTWFKLWQTVGGVMLGVHR